MQKLKDTRSTVSKIFSVLTSLGWILRGCNARLKGRIWSFKQWVQNFLRHQKFLDPWMILRVRMETPKSDSRGCQGDPIFYSVGQILGGFNAKCERSWLVQNSWRTPHIDTVFSQGPWTYNPLLLPLLQKSGPLYLKYSGWILKNSCFSAAQIPSQLLKRYRKVSSRPLTIFRYCVHFNHHRKGIFIV